MKGLLIIALIVVVIFMFRYSGYENKCTSQNPEFKEGKRCFDANNRVNLGGPFCKEECKGTWR
jgi:hypothetical protein